MKAYHTASAQRVLWALFFFLAAMSPAWAKTLVFPHCLEKSGTINSTQYTLDNTLELTYNPTLRADSNKSAFAQVDFYLYDDDTDELMRGATGEICGPCTFTMDAAHRKRSVRIDDLIVANGGGFDTPIKSGYGVVVISGPNSNSVNAQLFVRNSHTSQFDLSVFGFEPQPIQAAARTLPPGTPELRKTFVLPHILEKSGSIALTTNSFDMVIEALYGGGLPGTKGGTGVVMDLFLYDSNGQPMRSGAGIDVCNPCSFPLGDGQSTRRKQSIRLDDYINRAGGYGAQTNRTGFAVLLAHGDDPDQVCVESFVVNAHTGPFDLSVCPLPAQPSRPRDGTNSTRRTWVIPHILEKSGTISSTPFTFDTTIFITYTPGLAGIPGEQSAQAELYLYDSNGDAMRRNDGQVACGPCTFNLNDAVGARKVSIRIDDLITAQGSPPVDRDGFAKIVVSGKDPDGVNIESFVVNAHTGPFDLSFWRAGPRELRQFGPGGAPSNSPPARAYVIPHVLDTKGNIGNTTFTFDTTVFAAYTPAASGNGQSGGATVRLYLYDEDTSDLMVGDAGTPICGPCDFPLSIATPKMGLNMDDLISTNGGFDSTKLRQGFAVITVSGDADNLTTQGFVVNAHTGAFDLSVFGFEPQPLPASARVASPPIHVEAGGSGLLFQFPTQIGYSYTLESKPSLDASSWGPLSQFDGDGSVRSVPVNPAGTLQGFYRVKVQ